MMPGDTGPATWVTPQGMLMRNSGGKEKKAYRRASLLSRLFKLEVRNTQS